ncbi:MAG: amidohydrolase [Thermoanaerobaculia bacterium]|nr:MAG: amidohydrolase [Thermoanaerobaculia bacterium]
MSRATRPRRPIVLDARAGFAAALTAAALSAALSAPLAALGPSPLAAEIDARVAAAEGRLIEWRRHFHQHPELSNREAGTASFVAARLRELGLEPRTGVARHGVVAVIEGRLAGPTVALRADMDALPVAEEVDLPFASRAEGEFEGRTVPVMHACGHDAHTAMLLAAAEVLAGLRERLPGRVVLIFQPAEEGVPESERPAGAELMVAQGVLDEPRVDAAFALHVFAGLPSGLLGYRSGPMMAAADRFEIVVEGRQTHGSQPWKGADPIVAASAIVGALQTIVARSIDLTREPAVVSVGQFEAGLRNNIIPQRARLVGTIRTFDAAMRSEIHADLTRIAERVAEAHGTSASVRIDPQVPVTVNDPELLRRMLPTLERAAPGRVGEVAKLTPAEDFSRIAERVPSLYLQLGVTPAAALATAAPNHSPRFFVDESALPTGVRALAHLAADFLFAGAAPPANRP